MKSVVVFLSMYFFTQPVFSEISVPNIFGDNMVLQQGQNNPVWGWGNKGEKVTVSIAEQAHVAIANEQGEWRVELAPMPAGGSYRLRIEGSSNTLSFDNVLVGEVWLCSGQSNMEWPVVNVDHAELELASANYPDIHLITVSRIGSKKPEFNFEGDWKSVSPETVRDFSATCYFFGRRLHQILGVPVGLINAAWGGAPIESFIPRDKLEGDNYTSVMLQYWDNEVDDFSDKYFFKEIEKYEAWLSAGKPGAFRYRPEHILVGRHRPANIFNAMIHPILKYGIKGVLWCQGESNVDHAWEYRTLFPMLINTWRELWAQGDFPFYWVQLANFNYKVAVSTQYSKWAALREAQALTLSLPNTGQAVVIDLGESKDIHPRNKQEAANRLVRHALMKDYGYDMVAESPVYESMRIKNNKVIITFKHVDKSLYAFDTDIILGFYLAGKDKTFVNAEAKIIGKNTVEVSSDLIKEPVAVRYGWEDNPAVNLYERSGLPVTPFRTDDWAPYSKN